MKRFLCCVLFLALTFTSFVSCDNQTANHEFDSNRVSFLSAYNKAQELGYAGTLDEFIAMISGKDGTDGKDGIGIESIEYDENGDLIITFTDGSTQTVKAPENHVHNFGEWICYDSGGCSKDALYYRKCSECSFLEWKGGDKAEHKFETLVTPPTCKTEGSTVNKCTDCGFEKIIATTDKLPHSFENEYKTDSENHWIECSVCSEAILLDNHVFESSDTCDVCGVSFDCVDNNEDEICDNCGEEIVIPYPWDTTTIIFQMTYNTDNDLLSSGCERYMAGEDDTAIATVDTYVAERNSKAYATTKVSVTYRYWENVDEYSMNNVSTHIYNLTHSKTTNDTPDVYANFNVTMVGCSLKGCFANIKSETKGTNYFEFNDLDYDEEEDNRGYMMDYMESCTLSKHKMYVIASDYFIDMIRAFYVVPVNVFLLESVGPEITGDRDNSGDFTIDDFYDQVKAKEWDYDLVATYSEAISKLSSNSAGGKSIHDTIGFCLDSGALAGSGMLYSNTFNIIEKHWDDERNDYTYNYPTESPDFFELCDNLRLLMAKPGVYCVGSDGSKDYLQYGRNGYLAVRNRFCENKILFGSPMLLGALEFKVYQDLMDNTGFGVVPVPLYRKVSESSDEGYLTSIHNNGRSGAIAYNTIKFSQCTAFLNYQSTHSQDVLNDYYSCEIADGSKGTVEMLQYIRTNVRSNFDLIWEEIINSDIIENDASSGDIMEGGYKEDCWHVIVSRSGYNIDIREEYHYLYEMKMDRLYVLIGWYRYDRVPK